MLTKDRPQVGTRGEERARREAVANLARSMGLSAEEAGRRVESLQALHRQEHDEPLPETPVVETGQGEYARSYTPEPIENPMRGAVIGFAVMLVLVCIGWLLFWLG